MTEKIAKIMRTVRDEPELLEALKENPEALGDRFDLEDDELAALRSSDLLLEVRPKNPLLDVTTYTFDTGTTITANANFPQELEDLSKDELIQVFEHALVDDQYAKRVQRFLDL